MKYYLKYGAWMLGLIFATWGFMDFLTFVYTILKALRCYE